MQHPTKHIILAIPALVLIITACLLETQIIQRTGHVIYPIDDTYIHMAMARHFAQDGTLGVSESGFTAASSSPGWTLLLGVLIQIFGNHESIPFLINLLAATPLTLILTYQIYHYIKNVFLTLIYTILVLFILPLPTIICTGMEHTLHILLILLLVLRVVTLLTESKEISLPELFLLGMLTTLFRYETAFVIAPLCLLCFIHKNLKTAITLGLSCALPMILLGLFYLRLGWFFFPTSILQKSLMQQQTGLGMIGQSIARLYGQLFGATHLVVPFLLVLSFFLSLLKKGNAFTFKSGMMCFVFLPSLIFHCSLASIGWFYRYEAYLLTIGFLALAPLTRTAVEHAKNLWWYSTQIRERYLIRGIIIITGLLMLVPFGHHARSISLIIPGAQNLYNQQYQMGLFLRTYYSGETILANDIGAINYLADIHCLDMMGLGSLEPLRANRQNLLSDRFIQSWALNRGASIAVIYESWWRSIIPQTWIKVGEWTVPQKVTVSDPAVSFFAVHHSEVRPLKNHLQDFKSKLPNGIIVEIFRPMIHQ